MPSPYRVWSGAGGTGDGQSWVNAYTTLAGAIAVATADKDIIWVHYTHQEEIAADANGTLSIANNISIISVDKDNSDVPTAMGTGGWFGNSTTNRTITITGGAAYSLYMYGITLRTAGSTADSILIGSASGFDYTLENCYLWNGNTATTSVIQFGDPTNPTREGYLSLIDTTLRFGATAQGLVVGFCSVHMIGCSIDTTTATPTNLFPGGNGMASKVIAEGCNFSAVGTSLIANQTSGHKSFLFRQCNMPSTIMSAQTTYANRSQCEVWAFDCASGDTHYSIYYANALGTLTEDTSNFVTADGAERDLAGNKHSWKIVTTASASFANPFVTPWLSVYNESTSLTPYLEAQSATTGLNESDIWSDWLYKDYTNSTQAKIDRADRGGVTASTTDQAASSLTDADWTNSAGTFYFYKLSPGTITPTEVGDLSARVCVGVASATLYVDPKIRGL